MENLGEFLKKAREARGLSIDDVSKITRINPPMLRALEDNDLERLPARVIARGFIKSYCKVVGVNEYEALEIYDGEVGPRDADLVDRLQIGASDRSLKWIIIGALMAVVILGVFLFVYSGWYHNTSEKWFPRKSESQGKAVSVAQADRPSTDVSPPSSQDPAAVKTQAPVASSPQENSADSQQRQNPASPPSQQGASAAPDPLKSADMERSASSPPSSDAESGDKPADDAGKKGSKSEQVLVIEAKELTWVQKRIDDGSPEEITLYPGDKIVMRARKSINLYIGNAGGVRLTFNGKPVQKLGPSGKVVHVMLPPAADKKRN